MDSRYPSHEERRHRRPRRPHRGDQEDPEGHWHREHQYEDPEHSNQDIDPELESQSPSTGPTILPPGTSVSGYSRYMQTGQHPSYVSSAQQSYNPPSGGGKYDYSVYEYGTGQNAASSYQYDYGAGELQSPDSDRPRPEKKYICSIVGCNRGQPGNGFTTLNDLERHGRSKHGDDGQYIECQHPHCPDKGKKFPRRDNFIDHYWRVHGHGGSKDDVKAYALEMAKKWMVVKKAGNWGDS